MPILVAILQALMWLVRLGPRLWSLLVLGWRWLMAGKWSRQLALVAIFATGSIIKKIVSFLGLSIVTAHVALPALKPYISGPLMSLGDPWYSYISLTGVDKAVTVVLSAMVVRAASSISLSDTKKAENWVT